ncbi:LysR family transcriptional regulator [Sodalis sp. RH22]|uniref:LysR family transcriptional regulator n=1 Tax=unclassified Sodalis (in: enterobacteria) TaxID=2636512 RepID=UPI0039B56CF1
MTQSSPSLQDIAAFVAVAQHASFTRAAEQLGTSKANVGKAVQRLEARLGTKLFQRTTRSVTLTEDGNTYLDAARAALGGLHEAETALAARRDHPAGRVRLDIPVGFGGFILPSLPALRARYPLVTLDISLTDKATDAVGEGWDIVVRVGELPADGEMTVRKLCGLRLCLYAAPAYLDGRPSIRSVSELMRHEAVIFRSASGKLRQWHIFDEGRVREFSPNISTIVSDGRSLVDAARGGLGIAQVFDRVGDPYVACGELRRVLPAASVAGPPVHALLPLGRRMPLKTRVVLDHLADLMRSATAE